MADRPPRRLRGLTGQGDDLTPLLCAEGRRRPRARGVLETLGHGTAGACEPMATPAPDRGPCGAEAPGHVGCRQALRQQEDHVGPEAQVLGRLMGTDHRVERLALHTMTVARQAAWGQALASPLLCRPCSLSV
jgi:hypothetical protein